MSTKFDYCLAELHKMAEFEDETPTAPVQKKNPHLEALKIIGTGVAGLGAGHLAGVGAGKALEYFTERSGGNPANVARIAGPIVGGAAGILYPIWQAQQQKAIQNAVARAHNQPTGDVPRQ